MTNLLETHSISWAHSVKIALECEGLHAVILDENAPGGHGFAGRVRVAVPDGDLAKAQAVLARLTPRFIAPPSWRLQKRGLLLVGCGFLLASFTAGLLSDRGTGALTYALAALVVVVLVAGFLLIALGPRADTPSNPDRRRGAA